MPCCTLTSVGCAVRGGRRRLCGFHPPAATGIRLRRSPGSHALAPRVRQNGVPVPRRGAEAFRLGIGVTRARPRTALLRALAGCALLVGHAGAPSTLAPRGDRAAARTREPALAGGWYPDGRARARGGRSPADAGERPARGAARRSPSPSSCPTPAGTTPGRSPAPRSGCCGPGDFDRVVVVGPSHHEAFRGYALDDARPTAPRSATSPLCAGRLRRVCRRRGAAGATGRRPGALGRGRAAVPAGGARPLLPGTRARRRHRRDARARVRGAAGQARRRADAVRLLLRLVALRPALRLPAVRPALARGRAKVRALDDRAIDLLSAVNAPGVSRVPRRDAQHHLRPQRPRDAAGAAAAGRPAGPGTHPGPLRVRRHRGTEGRQLGGLCRARFPARAAGACGDTADVAPAACRRARRHPCAHRGRGRAPRPAGPRGTRDPAARF